MSDEAAEVKRGPGRPRKPRPELQPVQRESLTVNINDIAHDMADRSRASARYMINHDPDFPPAFKLNGQDHWLREDWLAYLRRKAQQAREAKEAQANKRARAA
ncbi:hypothetical protein CBA19CS22_36895 [Caballeronia novacaledonica]|uniref:Uncharacterized protein n=1 Tax=Caballeronia novacaledonica TaxID=1544861 RepID=A0ACB5R4Q0_9BURK|nr:hypothetical protein CBA19CS22_36895 [Caballeronia novacaledonica]